MGRTKLTMGGWLWPGILALVLCPLLWAGQTAPQPTAATQEDEDPRQPVRVDFSLVADWFEAKALQQLVRPILVELYEGDDLANQNDLGSDSKVHFFRYTTELFDTSSPHSSLSKITGDVLVQLELDPQTSPEEDAGDVTAETQTPDQYYPEVPQTLRHSQERVSARMQHNTEPLPETVLSKFVLVPVPRMSALPESQRASQAARRRGEDCTFFHGVSAVPVEIFDEARFADGLNEDGDGTQGGSGVAAQSVAEAGQILRACTEIVDTDCQALPVELSLLAGEIMNNLVRINWDRRLRLSQIPTCRVAGAISTYVAKSLMNPLEYPGLAEDSRCFWSLACQRIAQLTAGNE